MKASLFLDRINPLQIVLASIVFVLVNVFINLTPLSEYSSQIFNASFEVFMSAMISVIFLIMYYVSHKNHFVFSRTILWMGLTMVGWAIGDAIYLYFTIIDIDPFMTVADISYLSSYLLMIVAVLSIPGSQPPSHRRNMVFIEISILVLSAIVIFAILLLVPGNPDLNFDPFTLFMVFIYPVLDIILIWIIMILYFTYTLKSTRRVLKVLFAAAFCISVSDFFYLFNNLYVTLLSDYIVDLGYYSYYILLLLAGFIGFREIRVRAAGEGVAAVFKQSNWIVFLPGVFLITLIGLLLVFVLNQTVVMFHGIVVLIICIVILFIIHQYLVVADNIKLTREMREINAGLEIKVEQRTQELSKTNTELQDEMKEREKAEEHLARSNRELALLNKDKDKLFTILAHDLRSPLGSMMKLSELLVENIKDFDESEVLEVAGTLNRSAVQTFQLLNDLLAWSAVQMGRGEREKEYFQVSEIVSENISVLSSEAAKKQIELISLVEPEVMAFADKFAVQTVIRNLVSNAVKFTEHFGTITIQADQVRDMVQISVRDTGIGIPGEKQKKIFRVDSVSSSPGTDGEKGTGFGLLLCKDLVEKNGGAIWLESEKGKGSIFSFTLPVEDKGIDKESERTEIASGRIELKYDHAKKLGFSTFSGLFSTSVLKSEFKRVWSSTDYHADYSVLVDLRHASFDIESRSFQELLEIFTAMPGKQLNRKFALLTTTPQQVAYSTMFGQHIRTKYPFTIEVFSTYEGAISWLGLH